MVGPPTADPRRTIGWTEAAFGSCGMVGSSRRRSVTLVVRAVSQRRAEWPAKAARVSARRWPGCGAKVGGSSGDGLLELIAGDDPA
jgi:hypothetical protein